MLARPFAAAVLASLLLAGCIEDAARSGPSRDWAAEASRHGPVGVAATFDLAGSPLAVRGESGSARVEAPFTLAPVVAFPSERRLAFLLDAELPDGRRGLLVLAGATRATEGAAFGLAPSAIDVEGDARVGLAPSLGERVMQDRFPAGWEDAARAAFHVDVSRANFSRVTFEGFEAAAIVLPDGSGANLTAPVTVVRASGLAWSAGSVLTATRADATFARASVGGSVTGGSLRPEGLAPVESPDVVVVRDASLRMGDGRVATLTSARLTQAVLGDELLLDAGVEVAPDTARVTVPKDGTAWLRVDYREATFRGDAVLAQVSVEGAGRDLVTLPLERPPLLIQTLWDEAEKVGGVPGAFLALGIALSSPAIVLVDALNAIACVFATCPEQYPYPTWMDAGEVGKFYVKVEGKAPPGEYAATVTISGQNYEAITIPLTVTVTN